MIYGLSDLHLDVTKEKDMGIFGDNWKDYENRIITEWEKIVKEDDLVLVAGDISWRITIEDAYKDLIRIEKLPGKKILSRGNHDYWWSSLKKLNDLNLQSISFLQNNAYEYGDYVICGTRGWTSRDFPDFDEKDEKIFKRELIRLELSLEEALKSDKKIIAMIHYPPFNREKIGNEFHEMLLKYKVDTCVYGHLHGDSLFDIREGDVDGIHYHCLSGDYLGFKPKLIKE